MRVVKQDSMLIIQVVVKQEWMISLNQLVVHVLMDTSQEWIKTKNANVWILMNVIRLLLHQSVILNV